MEFINFLLGMPAERWGLVALGALMMGTMLHFTGRGKKEIVLRTIFIFCMTLVWFYLLKS